MKVALIAALALAFVLAGSPARSGVGCLHPAAAAACAAGAELRGEASQIEDLAAARMGDPPVRLRQGATRRPAAACDHEAALNGVAFAIAAAARARERPAPPAAPPPAPATRRQARAPPAFV